MPRRPAGGSTPADAARASDRAGCTDQARPEDDPMPTGRSGRPTRRPESLRRRSQQPGLLRQRLPGFTPVGQRGGCRHGVESGRQPPQYGLGQVDVDRRNRDLAPVRLGEMFSASGFQLIEQRLPPARILQPADHALDRRQRVFPLPLGPLGPEIVVLSTASRLPTANPGCPVATTLPAADYGDRLQGLSRFHRGGNP